MEIIKVKIGHFIYIIGGEKNIAVIFENVSAKGDIFIPRSIQYKSQEFVIKAIYKYAFKNSSNIKSITFPPDSELKTFYKFSFFQSSIKSIMIPLSATNLEDGWLDNTPKLNKIIIMEDDHRFKTYNDMIIGKTDTKSDAYDELVFVPREITEVVIPPFIKQIGPYAFSGSQIMNIFIPFHITSICEGAFDRCDKLSNVEFQENSELRIIGSNSFCFSKINKILIPSHVTCICSNVFSYCSNFKSIEIPENSELTKIEKNVFNSTPIKSFTIPSNLSQLEDGWCAKTSQLTNVSVIPNNHFYVNLDEKLIIKKTDIKSDIYDDLVFCCRDIKNMIIPSFIKRISPFAFENCYMIESIKIHSNLRIICENAFYNCIRLQTVDIPSDSLLSIIGKNAFNGCPIQKIFIPFTVTQICENAFAFCKKLKKVDFAPNSKLNVIEDEAFSETSISSILIPSSVTKIGARSFTFCSKLKKIEFQKNSKLKIIGNDSFSFSIIRSIIIPSEVEKIEEKAFLLCNELKKVEFEKNSRLQIIEKNAFLDSSIEELISIPSSILKLEDGWCNETPKLNKITINMTDNLNFIFYDQKFIIGKSDIESDQYDLLSFAVRNIKTAIIPPFIKNISSSSFESSSVKSVVIPSQVTHIKKQAFNKCRLLHKVQFVENSQLQIIEESAFANSMIENIVIPSHVTEICSSAFYFCKYLINVELSDDSELEIIDRESFAFSSIKYFCVPSKVKRIGDEAFEDCSELQIIELPENSFLKSIDKTVFKGCIHAKIMVPNQSNSKIIFT